MSRLFLDLDGVLADFDYGFQRLFGYKLEHGGLSDEQWARIHATPDFFRNLPPCRDDSVLITQAFQLFDQHNVVVLTSCPATNYEEVARQKKAWVKEHISHRTLVIPCRGARTKHLFMQSPSDILVDDFINNINRWDAAGGVAIHHKGDLVDTAHELLRRHHAMQYYGK